MNTLTESVQILRDAGGHPAFAVIPLADYQALVKGKAKVEPEIPSAVVDLAMDNECSSARAWREHKELTQTEVAAHGHPPRGICPTRGQESHPQIQPRKDRQGARHPRSAIGLLARLAWGEPSEPQRGSQTIPPPSWKPMARWLPPFPPVKGGMRGVLGGQPRTEDRRQKTERPRCGLWDQSSVIRRRLPCAH